MCIIIHTSSKSEIADSILPDLADFHGDGVGVMWHDGNGNRYAKSNNSWDYEDMLATVPDGVECAIHFRFATSGPRDDHHAHPFIIGNGGIMHNGILSSFGDAHRSDTKQFVDYLEDVTGGGTEYVDALLDRYARSDACRFLYLDRNGKFNQYGVWHSHQTTDTGWISYSSEPDVGSWYQSGLAKIDDGESWDRSPWDERNMTCEDWILEDPARAADMLEMLYYEGLESEYREGV